ncbi:MAG TPA: tetratricopeptide repeat protein, partial [Bacteroidia bacterium]|nr:tetratricopeptide repeat protein [Bacteroidia bacterium]
MSIKQIKAGFLLTCFLFAFTSTVSGQQNVADSIKRVIGFTNDANRINLLFKLTDAYLKYAPKRAIESATEAKILSTQLQNDTLEAKSMAYLGKVNYRIGNFKDAITLYDQAAKIYMRIGRVNEAAKMLNSMASAYQNMGNYNEGLNK